LNISEQLIDYYCKDSSYCVYDDKSEVDQRIPDNIEFEDFIHNKTGMHLEQIVSEYNTPGNEMKGKIKTSYDKVVLNEEKLINDIYKLVSQKDETIDSDNVKIILNMNQNIDLSEMTFEQTKTTTPSKTNK